MDLPPDAPGDEAIESLAPPPRIWPTLVVTAAVIPAALVMGIVVFILAMIVDGATDRVTGGDVYDWLAEFMSTPIGLIVMVVPGQILFAAAAYLPAMLSPQPVRERVGLVRGRLPLWSWPLLMLATPSAAIVGGILIDALVSEPSEQLKMLGEAITNPTGAHAVLVIFLLTVIPGFVEESIFRGYIQRRLLQRWHPAAAIALASVVFTAAHLDPQHSLAVFPLGIWLGVVAWRAGSIWPAILCHFFNNLFGIMSARLTGDHDDLSITFDGPTITTFAVVGLSFVLAVWVLVKYGRKDKA